MVTVCHCDARYAGCEHETPCPGTPGTRWSHHFCPPCDQRRRAHITANLTAMRDDLAARG